MHGYLHFSFLIFLGKKKKEKNAPCFNVMGKRGNVNLL